MYEIIFFTNGRLTQLLVYIQSQNQGDSDGPTNTNDHDENASEKWR